MSSRGKADAVTCDGINSSVAKVSTPPSMTNEQLWVLVKHYERLIALLLEQIDDDKRIDSGQR